MADISQIKLPDGTTYDISDARLPSTSSTDSGKILVVDSDGNWAKATLPIYDGTVTTP